MYQSLASQRAHVDKHTKNNVISRLTKSGRTRSDLKVIIRFIFDLCDIVLVLCEVALLAGTWIGGLMILIAVQAYLAAEAWDEYDYASWGRDELVHIDRMRATQEYLERSEAILRKLRNDQRNIRSKFQVCVATVLSALVVGSIISHFSLLPWHLPFPLSSLIK